MEPFFLGATFLAPPSVSRFAEEPHGNPFPIAVFSMGAAKSRMAMVEEVLLGIDPLLNHLRQKIGIQVVDSKFGALLSTISSNELTGESGDNSCVITDVVFWWSTQHVQSIVQRCVVARRKHECVPPSLAVVCWRSADLHVAADFPEGKEFGMYGHGRVPWETHQSAPHA